MFRSLIFVKPVYRTIYLYYSLSMCLVLWTKTVLLHAACVFSTRLLSHSSQQLLKTLCIIHWAMTVTFVPKNFLPCFDSTCTDILHPIAPFRTKPTKPLTEPWLGDNTPALRCTRVERRWRKEKLQIPLDILRDSLCSYQKAVKNAAK